MVTHDLHLRVDRRLAAASLPPCGHQRPGQVLQSAPRLTAANWADDATGVLVACGFDRCAVSALIRCQAGNRIASARPSDLLDMPQTWQVFDDGEPGSATLSCDPYQLSCRDRVAARGRAASSSRAGEHWAPALLPQHPARVDLDNDARPWVL